MVDAAHEWTDEQIEALERRFGSIYRQAQREMRSKLGKHMASFEKASADWAKRVKKDPALQEEYESWLRGRASDRRWIRGMTTALTEDAVRANQMAVDAINDAIPTVYAENANRAAYAIESGLGRDIGAFTLVDESTVRTIIKEDPDLVIELDPDKRRDYTWNRQKFNAAITQSVLQGESVRDAAKRIQRVVGMDSRAAVRSARTALTSAENAGRVSSYRRAQEVGVKLEQEWMATLDMRTRDSHRLMDGQHVPVGQKFPNGLEYPGDPKGPGEEVWNCRCTLVAWFPGIGQEDPDRWAKLPDGMTYEQWKGSKLDPSRVFADMAGSFPVDALHPETVGGVKRSSIAMSFDDANELRGNPRYSPIIEQRKAFESANDEYIALRKMYLEKQISYDVVSSAYDKAVALYNEYEAVRKSLQPYRINCQTCVVANEARRRGYDVMATGRIKGSLNERLAYNTSMAWIDPSTGKYPSYIMYEGPGKPGMDGLPVPSKNNYWKWLNGDGVIEEGNRYTIEFQWKDSSSGHIVSLERADGRLRLYDPQSGKTLFDEEVKEYLDSVRYYEGSGRTRRSIAPKLLRVDNMEFNELLTDVILEARS